MITKIDTKIPTKTNQRIIDLLYKANGWGFCLNVMVEI